MTRLCGFIRDRIIASAEDFLLHQAGRVPALHATLPCFLVGPRIAVSTSCLPLPPGARRIMSPTFALLSSPVASHQAGCIRLRELGSGTARAITQRYFLSLVLLPPVLAVLSMARFKAPPGAQRDQADRRSSSEHYLACCTWALSFESARCRISSCRDAPCLPYRLHVGG